MRGDSSPLFGRTTSDPDHTTIIEVFGQSRTLKSTRQEERREQEQEVRKKGNCIREIGLARRRSTSLYAATSVAQWVPGNLTLLSTARAAPPLSRVLPTAEMSSTCSPWTMMQESDLMIVSQAEVAPSELKS